MISMVVPSSSDHGKFTSYFRVAHKLLYDDLKDHDKTEDATSNTTKTTTSSAKAGEAKLSNNDSATVTDKLNMGFGSLVHVKGGPRSFSSASGSSSSSSSTSSCSNCQELLINSTTNDDGRMCSPRRDSESYVAVKGQTLIVTKKEGQKRGLSRRPSAVTLSGSPPKSSNSAGYSPEGNKCDPSAVDNSNSIDTPTMTDIERHLHQMTQLLRPEDSIKLIVRLESMFTSRLRYLAVVSCMEQETEEFCLLGIDCQGTISLGLVLAILSHTVIRLDGDGGFCVTYGDGYRSHIFKPVSVQTMWSALQSLYRASECAKKSNSFQVSAARYYDSLFHANKSDMACLNEWNVLPGVEPKRQHISNMSSDELSFQERISSTLREILLCERDLDEVTSKEIRTKLEHKLQVDLSNYKPFIDEEMLKILGQMEAPAMILENLYLGTEWNASHQQELCDKDIGYILNVTAEIDNFFPDTFHYMNIPVSDNEETDLLRYFNDSYRFINDAHKEGKNVLVHCKMGISRSATIVIAYVMKNRNWDLLQSMEHVKVRRTCVKPNPNFMKQLEVYEGILTAKRFSDTLEKRSKSESNLKQSDFSVASAKDSTGLSSGCGSRSNNTTKKSPKKYYNTAPARLKPEKHSGDDARSYVSLRSGKSTLSRPKSCSCATLPAPKENGKICKDDSFVHRDVLDSFQEVVKSLEQSSPSSVAKPKLDLAKQTSERSSLPNIADCWLKPLPMVKVISDESSYVSKETVVLNTTTLPDEPQETSQCSEADQNTQVDSSSEMDTNQEHYTLKVPNSPEIAPVTSNDEVDKATSDQNSARKATPLKCCRRPFNGHTFSVSPNQVVNISSSGDFSKFSVRHLVNEFELHSSRNSLNSHNSTDAPVPGILTPSAISDSSPSIKRSCNLRRKSKDTLSDSSSHSGDEQSLNTSIEIPKPEKIEQELLLSSVIQPNKNEIISEEIKTSVSEMRCEDSSSDKESKSIGCLPFLKGQSCSSVKFDRSAKEAASNTIVKLIKSHQMKKTSEGGRSREKFKDRGNRPRLKINSVKERSCETEFPHTEKVHDIGSSSSGIFQKTGVVKQRLEAFEAKSVSSPEQHYNNRSHNRSHSATPSSTINIFSKEGAMERFSLGHRRKTSMPHLNSNSLINDSSQSNSSLNITSNTLFNRKGSLDSNTLFRSIPNISNRPFTVRGFQSPSSQSMASKFPFSSSRHHRNNTFGFNGSSSGRQQHGSTHPLKLLPQTTKLTQ